MGKISNFDIIERKRESARKAACDAGWLISRLSIGNCGVGVGVWRHGEACKLRK